jgi:DNA-binding CsgD family transcriptional regulator
MLPMPCRHLNDEEIHYCELSHTGMMIMDGQGNMLFQSEVAKNLLCLANYAVLPMDSPIKLLPIELQLGQICRNLSAIFQGKEVVPPSFTVTNGLGKFQFRANWMDSVNNEQAGLIGITIEHHEPTTLKIHRALQKLPLSPMQKEVGLLLAQGATNAEIGQRLHIKLTTVKDHISKIFTKLDIQRREELLPKLLAIGSFICQKYR